MTTRLPLVVLLLCPTMVFLAGAASASAAEAAAAAEIPSQKRDPFAPALRDAVKGSEINPLERFAVAELRLVATVGGIDPPRALIEDPSGLGFIVTLGTIVGAERRAVVSIGAGRIVLENRSNDPGKKGPIVMLAGQNVKPERQ